MPGAVARTSTLALTNATLPYAVQIANMGWRRAMQTNPEIRAGANVVDGRVTYRGVAEAFNLPFVPAIEGHVFPGSTAGPVSSLSNWPCYARRSQPR